MNFMRSLIKELVVFSKRLSGPVWSSQFDLHWAGPHLPWWMRMECFKVLLFFRSYFYPLGEIFVNQRVLLHKAEFTLKTALNSLGECNEFADHHHESFCLSIDSLSCAKRSLDFCILFKFIFLYLRYIPPTIVLFTHFAYTNFFMCIL